MPRHRKKCNFRGQPCGSAGKITHIHRYQPVAICFTRTFLSIIYQLRYCKCQHRESTSPVSFVCHVKRCGCWACLHQTSNHNSIGTLATGAGLFLHEDTAHRKSIVATPLICPLGFVRLFMDRSYDLVAAKYHSHPHACRHHNRIRRCTPTRFAVRTVCIFLV